MAANSVALPLWTILKQVFAMCWRERRFVARHMAVPLAIMTAVDVAGTLAGVNVLSEFSWIFVAQVALLLASAPLAVSWMLRAMGDPQAQDRARFALDNPAWHVINANVLASVLIVGGGVVLAGGILRIATAAHAFGQTSAVVVFDVLAAGGLVLLVTSYARFSMAPALAAIGYRRYVRSAWTMTRAIPFRLTALYLICFLVFSFISQAGAVVIDSLGGLAGVVDEENPGLWTLGVSVSTSFFNLLLIVITNALFAQVVLRLEAAEATERFGSAQ